MAHIGLQVTLCSAYGLDTSTALPHLSLSHQQQHADASSRYLQDAADEQAAIGRQAQIATLPPPPLLENAFHVSVAPVAQPLKGAPPADVVLIVSIGPILFRMHTPFVQPKPSK